MFEQFLIRVFFLLLIDIVNRPIDVGTVFFNDISHLSSCKKVPVLVPITVLVNVPVLIFV